MQPRDSRDHVRFEISVLPSVEDETRAQKPKIPEKLRRIMRKYKYNWRIDQLSQPRVRSRKYTESIAPLRKSGDLKLSERTEFFADHMSRARLKDLYVNKRLYGHQKQFRQKIDKTIEKSWNSMYNFYKKRQRDRRLRQLRLTIKESKREVDLKRFEYLAKPKSLPQSEPVKRKPSKIFTNYDRLDDLAAPKPFVIIPPKSLAVNPAALIYEPTENILRLAKVPSRLLNLPKPLEPGKVKRSALSYEITPRIAEIALPKQRSEKANVDEDFDPWAIPKNALTYKATPRILELARPIERD